MFRSVVLLCVWSTCKDDTPGAIGLLSGRQTRHPQELLVSLIRTRNPVHSPKCPCSVCKYCITLTLWPLNIYHIWCLYSILPRVTLYFIFWEICGSVLFYLVHCKSKMFCIWLGTFPRSSLFSVQGVFSRSWNYSLQTGRELNFLWVNLALGSFLFHTITTTQTHWPNTP